MAEIAIPLVALGGLYIASNQKKTTENFSSGGLPGIVPPIPAKNYPTLAPVSDSNLRKYRHPNQVTDKFYSEDVAMRIAATNPPGSVGSGCAQPRSLTGNVITKEQFTHNNMVPFFGARVRGATLDANCAESRMDNLQGAGSQMIEKTEQAPLFKPHKDLQYAHGAPNVSEFMMSRVNPSQRMANVKPWEEEKVPPGLNMGYTAEAGSGYNAGVDSRDSWLPKTVNELRVDTNPKLTYGLQGLEGPALAPILEPANISTQGRVEKYRPDTYYDVGPSRWFTTKGMETAPTARGIEVLQNVNRSTTSCEYYGAGKDGEASYTVSNHETPKRPCLGPNAVTNATAAGQYHSRESDFGAQSYEARPNNRGTTGQPDSYGSVYGLVKAAIAPILDILRPSRKENVVGNARPNGNVSTTIIQPPVHNPGDRLKTTIKETTVGKLDCNHLNLENQHGNAYLVSDQQPSEVQRDTTNCSYLGSAGPGDHAATMNYSSAYRQRNNPNKSYPNRPNQGGTQIFSQKDNISIHRRDADRDNNRMWAPSGAPAAIPSQETYGKINAPQYYNQCTPGCDRIDPNILSAFKSNPYTQSLNSWA